MKHQKFPVQNPCRRKGLKQKQVYIFIRKKNVILCPNFVSSYQIQSPGGKFPIGLLKTASGFYKEKFLRKTSLSKIIKTRRKTNPKGDETH